MTDNEKTTVLPQAFLERMKGMLGDDYPAFLESYSSERTYGLRVNTAKISCEEFEKIVPFPVRRIPWTSNGYFYDPDVRPSRCIYYQAGLYYLQDPSAMAPAACLPVRPGDFVLDLCAAPGGKATAAGAALQGTGLLVANDISNTRAKALLRNIELFGLTNTFVTNETPARLADTFGEYFDKIILDAPCSGEGMFRKEEALAKDWTEEKSKELAALQRELILQAASMLRLGGMLLYSTCTFAPEEDEGTVSFLLSSCPDMKLVDIPGFEGFTSGVPAWGDHNESLTKCIRIFPHKMAGEGHFFALFQKDGASEAKEIRPCHARPDQKQLSYVKDFFQELGLTSLGGVPIDWKSMEIRASKVYYTPSSPGEAGLSFLRNGLYVGDLKKNRFEPSQPLALAIRKGEASAVISLAADDPRLTRFLKGETLEIAPEESALQKGWHLLCADGYPVGFGKLVNGVLKNKYPAGWRV